MGAESSSVNINGFKLFSTVACMDSINMPCTNKKSIISIKKKNSIIIINGKIQKDEDHEWVPCSSNHLYKCSNKVVFVKKVSLIYRTYHIQYIWFSFVFVSNHCAFLVCVTFNKQIKRGYAIDLKQLNHVQLLFVVSIFSKDDESS